MTREQKDAWLAKLRDPATPLPRTAFSGKCALYYALPASQYASMDAHWHAVNELVGNVAFNAIAEISDTCVMQERSQDAFVEASAWIEENIPCSDG